MACDAAKTLTVTGPAGVTVSTFTNSSGGLPVNSSTSITVTNGQFLELTQVASASTSTTTTMHLDFGDGSTYDWNVTTAPPSPWPLINVDSADTWDVPGTTGRAPRA